MSAYKISPNDIKFDNKIADFNPTKPKEEYNALLTSIHKRGQDDPILIRNGLCGDGRHRVQICKDLNIDVLAIDVNPAMSDKDFIAVCNNNTFTARNDTPAQKAIKAYKLSTTYNYSDTEAMTMVGVKNRRVMSYIRTLVASEFNTTYNIIPTLELGNKVTIADNSPTASIEVATKYVKQLEEANLATKAPKPKELLIDYNTHLETQRAREEFWTLHSLSAGVTRVDFWLALIVHLNVAYGRDALGLDSTYEPYQGPIYGELV